VAVCGHCLLHPPELDLCLCATDYGWPWRDLIRQFKFHNQPSWAGPLATLMLSTPWVEDTLAQADCVLPMPLSRERLATRGYNQALLLARRLAPDKTQAQLLLRTRDTAPQSGLPRHERLANLEHALAVDPLQATSLHHRRVVLVDDVMTSGASLQAAARALRQHGVAHVAAIVLARTPEGMHDHDDSAGAVFQ
jgi:ComF family protein